MAKNKVKTTNAISGAEWREKQLAKMPKPRKREPKVKAMTLSSGIIGSPASIAFTETFGASSSITISDGNLGINYRRVFLVGAPDMTVGAWQIRNAPGLPQLTDPYVNGAGTEHDDFAFCTSITVDQIDDTPNWNFVAEYGPYDPVYNNIDPTQSLPKPSWSLVKYEENVDIDVSGNIILNSALDLFDPTLTRDQSRLVLNITWNQTEFDYVNSTAFVDTCNSGDWFSFSEGQVKIADITCSEPIWSPIIGSYFPVSFTMEVNPFGWVKNVIDSGTRQLVSDGGGTYAWQNIKTDDGSDTNSVVLLDGSGNPLSPDPSSPLACFVLTFQIYRESDFSTLSFPPLTNLGLGPGV